MSLIDDALKAAQREKSRLDAQAGRPFAPVLVRLRSHPGRSFDRRILLAAGGLLLATLIFAVWQRNASAPPLPAVPPVTSAILSEALASDSVRGRPPAATAPSVRQAARPVDPAAPVPGTPSSRLADAGAVVRDQPAPRRATPPAAPIREAPSAQVLDGASSAPVPDAAQIATPRQSGALRIAVERPQDADAARLFAEAVQAHRAGNLARARSLYEQVIVLAPNDGDALNNLGVLLSANREFDRALELLRRATTIAPRRAAAWNNIGNVMREQGRVGDAIAAFREALVIDEAHLGARIGLAQQYLAIDSLAQARTLLQAVVLENASIPEAHYTLGQVQERLGDRVGAMASYSAFVRIAPPRLAAHAELVRRRIDALAR